MVTKRVLVTGANGFIGKRLCDSLIQSGFLVRGTFRNKVDKNSTPEMEELLTGPIECVDDWTEALEGVDAIVHTAAVSDIPQPATRQNLSHMFRVNVTATINLGKAALDAQVKKFIYLSSAKVNGLSTGARPFSSDDKPSPCEPYGDSKAAAERALQQLSADSELDLVILRPGLVYGPNPRGSVLRLFQIVNKGIPLPFGWVANRRSLVAVQNLCNLIGVCIDHPNASNRVFLVADGKDLSTPELIDLIATHMKRRSPLIPVPLVLLNFIARLFGKQSELDSLVLSLQLDTSETEKLLGWTPPLNIDTAIKIAVSDFLGQ